MAESATSVGSLTFLGLFAMFSLSPLTFTHPADLAQCPPQARSRHHAPRGTQARPSPAACPLHPQTSYWLSDANEMAAIKTILIIVNSFVA